ncbi:AfsR/SARP family transcriptional regulator [Asanoa ishikariensis]|nr:hypothetical protein [Asanoa ishikariensis]
MLLTGPAVAAAAAAVVPHHRPTLDQVSSWADNPLTARSVAVAAVFAAALIWAILAAAAVVSILAAPRPTAWLRRLPLPHPVKTALLAVAGTAALGTAAPAATHQPAAATTGADEPTRPGADQHQPSQQPVTASTTAGFGLADGSWIPRPLAETITAAAAALWWRRRRDYRPHTAPAGLRDSDLPAPSPTVAAVIAHLAADDTEPSDHDATIHDPTGPLPPPMPVAHLPAGGLTLTGDGAAAAARGILISTLLDRQTRILTTATTLDTLLGAHRPTDMPGIDVVAGPEEVDERVEGDRTGPSITILEITDNDDTARLTELPHTRSAVTIILGNERARTAWHVDDDGTTHTRDGHSPHRLCVLTPTAANDLLTLAAANSDGFPQPHTYATARNGAGGSPVPAPLSTTAGHRSASLRLCLLGTLALEKQDAPIHIRRSAGWQILAYLAIHPAGATSRQLITAIWPHLHPTTIAGRLYTTINELRKAVPTDNGATIIERDADNYRLNADIVDVDLWLLTSAHQRAVNAPESEARTAALRAVIDTYRGELAAGRQWPWLTQPRETIHRHVIDACTALSETSTPTQAIDLLRHATEIDPVNQHLQHRLHEACIQLRSRT